MAFLTETFTFSYITCTFGPEWVGLILIFFGIANSVGCIVLSYLQPYIGRITIFVKDIAYLCHKNIQGKTYYVRIIYDNN